MAKHKAATAPTFDPVVVRDPYSMVGARWLIVGETFQGVKAVGYQPAHAPPMLGTVDRVIQAQHLPNYSEAPENSSLQSFVESLKALMVAHGASPLAVEWIGDISPFSEKELNIMADKLKTKTEKAAKPAAKSPAPRKGNPQALEMARAARASAAKENRKYKTLVKLSDIKLREGSWTATMVTVIMTNKTTDDAKAELAKDKQFGDRRLDFGWAEGKGYIEFV